MRPNKDKVARRWLKKQAEISAPAKPPALPAGKMADLMAFVMAVDAWMERLEALGLKPTGPIDARALPLLRKSVPLLRDAVTIGTIHSWKGLEVRNMFVPMVGSKFPRSGPEGITPDGPQLASERRLAYVAITRAEQRCVVLDIPHPKLETRSQFVSEACLPSEQPMPDKRQAPKEAAARLWDDRTVLQLIAETERMA